MFEVYPFKFRISTICSFPVIHPRTSQRLLQRSLLLNISIAFYACKQIVTAKKIKSKQAMNMKFSVCYVKVIIYLMLWICITVSLKFSRQDCLIQLVSYKNTSELCQKDPKLSEMPKVIIYHKVYYNFFQNLLFWRFEFQDDLIYYHIKWLDLLGE